MGGSKKNKEAKKQQYIPAQPAIPVTRPLAPMTKVNFQSSNQYQPPPPSYKSPSAPHSAVPPRGPSGSTVKSSQINPSVTYYASHGLSPIPLIGSTSEFMGPNYPAQASWPSAKKTTKVEDNRPMATRTGIKAPRPFPSAPPLHQSGDPVHSASCDVVDVDDFSEDECKTSKLDRHGETLKDQRYGYRSPSPYWNRFPPSSSWEGTDKELEEYNYSDDDGYSDDGSYNDDSDGNSHDDPKSSWIPGGGGPKVQDLLPNFRNHVAADLWKGEDPGCLKFTSRAKHFSRWNFRMLRSEAKNIVASSGLQHLEEVTWPNHNLALISAFVERWQPDTNTFHMPFGEMTITLHDVWHILRIPITGKALAGKPLTTHVLDEIATLFEMPEDPHLRHRYEFTCQFIIKRCAYRCAEPISEAFGYLLYLLANSLFPVLVEDIFRPEINWLLRDMQHGYEVSGYAWGAATLAFLYRQLRRASHAKSMHDITGCLTLFECWIYEYFPMFRPACEPGWKELSSMARAGKWRRPTKCLNDPQMLAIYRARLDNLTKEEVCWLPYGKDAHVVGNGQSMYHGTIDFVDVVEPYMPVRVLRQFGFMQVKPASPIKPNETYRPSSSMERVEPFPSMKEVWETPGGGILNLSSYYSVANPPWLVSHDYMAWYLPRTHPCIVPPHKKSATDPLALYTKASEIMRPWFPSQRQKPLKCQYKDDESGKMFTSFEEGLRLMELANSLAMQSQSKSKT